MDSLQQAATIDHDGTAGHPGPASRSLLALYTPHALIFFSSACIMIVELVAGRMIARHLGSSLYTWTSIIGVVLAGMSVGNMVGGRLADRVAPRAFIGMLFLAASLCCMLSIYLNAIFASSPVLAGSSWPARVFATVVLIFFLPAVVLGTISPVTAKMALERSETLGRTIGSVYAWGAVGSICGTLATGFWLIALMGVQNVVLLTALLLAGIGLVLGPKRWIHGLWTLVLFVLLVVTHLPSAQASRLSASLGLRDQGGSGYLFGRDGDYQYVKVYTSREPDRDRPAVKRKLHVLALDHLVHGYVDLSDAKYLHYAYERIYRDVALSYLGRRKPVRAFFIGGGSYTFPRLVREIWPKSEVDVAEIDPLVVEANHRALGLPRDTTIRSFILDARNAVDDLPPTRRYDLIVGDAFNDLSVPFHLVTLEFTQKLSEHLAAGGVYLLNLIDNYRDGHLLCSMVATMEKVFPHVYVFSTSRWGIPSGRETFVIAASKSPLAKDGWEAGHSGGKEGSLLDAAQLAALDKRCGAVVLRDGHAPVENLLLPVVRARK